MTATTFTSFESLRQRYQAMSQAKVPLHLARLRWTAEQIAAHQRDQLRLLLTHAMENSPFHAARLRGVDVASFEPRDLATLPVMTKSDMMANFDEAVTDRRLTLAAVDAHLAATGDLPEPFAGEYVCTTSGGSSGLRGVFVYSLEAFVDIAVGFLRPAIAQGMAAGGPPPGGLVVAIVAAPTAIHGTSASGALVNGSMTRIINAPVTLPVSEIVSRLNQGQPQVLVGYPTAIRQLAAEQQAGRLAISPRQVITTSEQLTPEASRQIQAAFGVPVINSFGCSEGVLGSSAPGREHIVFASDLAILELVDADNRPVPAGTPSAKVLVTNLCNTAQPLIRYELTDSFVRQPDAAEHGHLVATVEGRAYEPFEYGELRIHPLVIYRELVATPEVIEYQVRQTRRGVDVDIVVSAAIDESKVAGAISRSLSSAGLLEPDVSVRTVAGIERNAQTGKIRRFVPLA